MHAAVIRSGVHTLVLTASRIVAVGFGFALHVVLGRTFGVADYGLYALGRSVLDICSVIAKLGFENTLMRYLPKRRIEVGTAGVVRVAVTALAVASTLGAVLCALVYVLAPVLSRRLFDDADMERVLRGFALCIVPYALLGLSGAALRALHRVRAYAIVQDLCFPALHLALVVAAAAAGFGILGAVGAAFVASLTCALTMLTLIRRMPGFAQQGLRDLPRPDTTILPFAFTLLAANLAATLVMPASRLLLGAFGTMEQVGLFNAAAVIALQTAVVLTGANKAFAPIVAELHTSRDRVTLALTYKRITKWVVIATLPLCLVMVVFPADLLGLFGHGFPAAAGILVVLVAGQFVNAVTGSVGVVLNMTGRHRLELYNRWAMVPPVVILNLILIPGHGAMGAAVATSAALIVINLVRVLQVYLLEGMHPFSGRLTRAIAIAALLVFAGVVAQERPELQAVPWPLQALVLLGVYSAAVLRWCLEVEDQSVIERVTRRFRLRARPPSSSGE